MRCVKTHVRVLRLAVIGITIAAPVSIATADKPNDPSDTSSRFVLSQSETEAAYLQGIVAAKEGKPAAAILEDVQRQPIWVAKKHGPAKGCSVWFTTLAGANVRIRGHQSWRNDTRADRAVVTLEPNASISLDFDVTLRSLPENPRVAWQNDLSADSADVRVERFELLDDRGHKIVLKPAPSTTIRAEELRDFHNTDWSLVSGSEVAYSLPSLEFSPDSERPNYVAYYRLRAALRDAQGKARISPEAREIRLVIVTRTGQMEARYPLPALSVQTAAANQVARWETQQ
jgi:hypothetical protein